MYNNIPTINQINAYTHQRSALVEFDSYLESIDTQSNRDLDEAVDNMKSLVRNKMGLRLKSVVDIDHYVINHRQMERVIKRGLQCYGVSGATTFDNEQLAMTMLDAPVRDYNFKYFVAPKYQRLANLKGNSNAVFDLWSHVVASIVQHYGKKPYHDMVKN